MATLILADVNHNCTEDLILTRKRIGSPFAMPGSQYTKQSHVHDPQLIVTQAPSMNHRQTLSQPSQGHRVRVSSNPSHL